MSKFIYIKNKSLIWNLIHWCYQLLERPIWSLKGVFNKLKYGKNAPEFGELIYINPLNITSHAGIYGNNLYSGSVKSGDWDLDYSVRNNLDHMKFRACIEHWSEGKQWEETEVFQKSALIIESEGHVDGYKSIEELKERYRKLDKLFEQISVSRTFKTQKELNRTNFNENGGIYIHIDRNNQPIWFPSGVHRMAMATVLKLDCIPAQLGVVHKNAIKEWKKYKDKDYCRNQVN